MLLEGDFMKKVAIITLQGCNYGNRLQNYAVQQQFKNKGVEVYTLKNTNLLNSKKYGIKNNLKLFLSILKSEICRNGVYRFTNSILTTKRVKKFLEFNKKYINFSSRIFSFNRNTNYDLYVVGSDQVWNPYFGLGDLGLLSINIPDYKKIAFSASIGVNTIPTSFKEKFTNELKKFSFISVREDKAKDIIGELVDRDDVQVLVDPTMLLSAQEWDKIACRPSQLDNIKEEKFILNYFLGELSEKRKKEIERVAQENNCNIINILDKNDPFYSSGPSEFLYLEKHAFLICTDSFHSCVFAILYNRPFVVFDREQNNMEKMNSRIETLLSKFKLKNRMYNGNNITKHNLEHDYSEAYSILEKERIKSNLFIDKSLNQKKSN